jgi:hypothetical protein
MKIKVDDRLKVIEFGRQIVKGEARFYYQVVGYNCLVLVMQEGDYVSEQGEIRIALFNFDSLRGDIICDRFPKAPAAWQDADLVQCSIRRPREIPKGRGRLLSAAVIEMLGSGC